MEKRKKNMDKKEEKIESEKKFTLKDYLTTFAIFFKEKLAKSVVILLVIAIILSVIMLKISLGVNKDINEIGDFSFFKEIINGLKVFIIIIISGIIPYLYAPVIGFVEFLITNSVNLSKLIIVYGFGIAILKGIIPFLINIISICLITSIGIYICREITLGYKISSSKDMNFTSFKIQLYKSIGNEKKSKEIAKKRDEKVKKLENKKTKIEYLQIINVIILVTILQVISALIEKIVL